MSTILDQFGQPLVVENSGLANPERWFVDWVRGGSEASSGESVSESSSLRVPAVFACVRNISEDVAKLPLVLYRRLKPRGKERETGNPLYSILHDAPNDEMSSFTFRQAMTFDVLLYGNAYAEIVRTNGGAIAALNRLDPSRVSVKRDNQSMEIYYEHSAIDEKIPPARMFHLRGPGDGLVGWSVIKLARETIGTALALDKFNGSSMGNDSTPGGVLKRSTGSPLSLEARNRLRTEWEQMHRGSGNRRRIAVLEDGLEFQPISIPPEDAQFLERMQHSVEDIARWYRMPPHKIQHLLRSTFSNIEHQNLEYVTDCLMPWLVRWEQEIRRKLIDKRNKDLFAEHLVTALLRGNAQERSAYYREQFNIGALSQNDIRELENMNPIDGGDTYYVNAAMIPSDIASTGEILKKSAPESADFASAPDEKSPDDAGQDSKNNAPSSSIDRKKAIADSFHEIFRAKLLSIYKTRRDRIASAKKRKDLDAVKNMIDDVDGSEEKHITSSLLPIFLPAITAMGDGEPSYFAEKAAEMAKKTAQIAVSTWKYHAESITGDSGDSIEDRAKECADWCVSLLTDDVMQKSGGNDENRS